MNTNENINTERLKTRIDEQANLVRQLKGNATSQKVALHPTIHQVIRLFSF
jgi:hypothetical protein